MGDYDFTTGLDVLDLPVLVLWGEDDPFGMVYPEATEKALAAAELDVIVLPACSHYWHECPDAFLDAARAFLTSSESGQ